MIGKHHGVKRTARSARARAGIIAGSLAGLGVAALVLATSASATVTFDPSTGTGFVGKGDVQTAFGWNNQIAQAQANNVSFEYDATKTYDVTIEFDTGGVHNTTHHTVTQSKDTMVSASVAYSARQSPNQYTGWNLTGLGTTTTTGDSIPSVGDSCSNGDLGTCQVTDVELTSSSGGLYVSDSTLSLGPVSLGSF
jgi:hypothetical protein